MIDVHAPAGLELAYGLYLWPTPAGTLHAASAGADRSDPAVALLRSLLRTERPVRTDLVDVAERTGLADPDAAIAVVADAQAAGWLEGRTEPPSELEGPLGRELPALLAPLSDEGRAALVDDQGFLLGSVGFTAEAEEELSILAAEVSRLAQRRTTATLATGEVRGWGLVDRHGATTVGLYPLAVGDQPFVLIVGGLPRLHHPAVVALVAALSRRYDPLAPPEP